MTRSEGHAGQGAIVFVNDSREELGTIDTEQLQQLCDAFVVGLIDRCHEPSSVSAWMETLRLVDDVPAQLLLSTALRILVCDVIATLDERPEVNDYFRAVVEQVRAGLHLA